MVKHIYESHMGGFFFTDRILEDTYCDSCGDSDTYIGSAETKSEAIKLIRNSMFGDLYTKKYIREIVNEEFGGN